MTPNNLISAFKKYVFNLLYWLDKGGNTLLGGSPDETISRRSARAAERGARWGRAMCVFLNWFDQGHCSKARARELGEEAWKGVAPDSDSNTEIR